MTVTLNQVVPWGRSMNEYRAFFALTNEDLGARILGCGDEPASFNAEMTAAGHDVVSVDPLYAFVDQEIAARVDATYSTIINQVEEKPDDLVWTHFRNPADLGTHRRNAMHRFLDDYAQGRSTGRYRLKALPALGFGDGRFDLALCSHLLLLYSEQLLEQFHIASVRELLRVANQVRIFRLLARDGRLSPHLNPLTAALQRDSFRNDSSPCPTSSRRAGIRCCGSRDR